MKIEWGKLLFSWYCIGYSMFEGYDENIYILILLFFLIFFILFNGKNIYLICNMIIFIKVVLWFLFDEKEWIICSVIEKIFFWNSWWVFVKLC